jgi:hypothetical protein
MLTLPKTSDPSLKIAKDMLDFGEITPENQEDFTVKLMQLITKEQLIVNSFKLGPSHIRKYLYSIKDSDLPAKTMMHIMMQFYMFNTKVRQIVHCYENDIGYTRDILHYLNEQTGEDKVPYIWLLFQALFRKMYNEQYWTLGNLLRLVQDETTIDHIKELQESSDSGLKVYSGETNTNCTTYDHLRYADRNFTVDKKSIRKAEYRADLGGGLATPYISMLLGSQYVTHDLNDPKQRAHDPLIHIVPPANMRLDEYRELLAVQPFKEFNVYDPEGYPKDYNSYSIVSFGFLTSTVKTINPMDNEEHNYVSTTYHGVKQIMDLVAMGKEVHCLFYGRPTVRVYENTVIQLKFVDRKCTAVDLVNRVELKKDSRNLLYGSLNMGYIINQEENEDEIPID